MNTSFEFFDYLIFIIYALVILVFGLWVSRNKEGKEKSAEESSTKLKELNELLNAYPNANVIIEGHASSDGSMAYNQTLSEKRAASVKDALIAMGVDASRLETVGYGETKPSADNKTSAGRSANRRVEFERKVEIKVVE